MFSAVIMITHVITPTQHHVAATPFEAIKMFINAGGNVFYYDWAPGFLQGQLLCNR